MLRNQLTARGAGNRDRIGWRGGDVSRIEGFSDAVFAFAVALLVVSLEVPLTFMELEKVMMGFIGFAGCFALLVLIWYNHYLFFRRFGLEDPLTIFLNAVLLFVILFYIYPLKFLSKFVIGIFVGFDDGMQMGDMLTRSQGVALMIIYAAGYATIFALYTLLYARAYSMREELKLTLLERFDVRWEMLSFGIHILVATISALIVLIFGVRAMAWSGFAYFLIGAGYAVWSPLYNRRRNRLEAAGG